MDELNAALERMKGRWMTGGAGADGAPAEWRAVLEGCEPAEAELRLVALVGQAMQVAQRPAAPPDLKARPDLPALPLPSLPDALRPRFRRVLASLSTRSAPRNALLMVLAARGYAAHPADWTPAASDETTPTLYAPWRDWSAGVAAAATPSGVAAADALTAESWDDFAPAERRAILGAIRRTAPDRARALLEEKFAGEAADQRTRLVETLEFDLGEADIPFLESLAADRSTKVREIASRYLARLGHGAKAGEMEAELADFLLKRKVGPKLSGVANAAPQIKLSGKSLKTGAQRRRLEELFELVSLGGLAAALEMSPQEVLETWDVEGPKNLTYLFADMVRRTAPDALMPAFAVRLAEQNPSAAASLAERLDPDLRAELAIFLLGVGEADLESVVVGAGPKLGGFAFSQIEATAAYEALQDDLALGVKDADGAGRAANQRLEEQLFHFGLIADADAASAIVKAASDAGLFAVDPRLDMLQLNAALPPKEDPKPR